MDQVVLPRPVRRWMLTTLREKLIKTRASSTVSLEPCYQCASCRQRAEHRDQSHLHLIKKQGLANVNYQFYQDSAYWNPPIIAPNGFDLVIVDGSHRSNCIEFALRHLKPDAVVYLDNSDKHPAGGDTREAEAQLLERVQTQRGRAIYFTDFAPTDLFVNQEILALFGKFAEKI